MKMSVCFLIMLGMLFPVCLDALSLDVSQVRTEEEAEKEMQVVVSGKWDWEGDRTELDIKGRYIKATGRSVKYDIGLLGKATFYQDGSFFGQAGYDYYHTHHAPQFALGLKGRDGGLHAGVQIEYPDGRDHVIRGKVGAFYERKRNGSGLSCSADYIFDETGAGRFDIEADAKAFFMFAYCGIGVSRIRSVLIQRSYVGVEF